MDKANQQPPPPGAANNNNNSHNNSNPSQPPVPISITICGDGGCGKSSITLRLVHSQYTAEYDPTIEDSYSITRRIDGTTYHLALTDTAGQEEYRSMWGSANLGADAFLLVYDITAPDSLEALGYFNELVDMEADTRLDNAARARRAGLGIRGDDGGAGRVVPPVKMVVGNKCDLKESRQVPAAQGLEWARRRGCGFMETSARLEVNIEETFALLVRRVVEARKIAEFGTSNSGGNNNNNNNNAEMDRHGVTRPLTPLDDEKRGVGVRGPRIGGSVGGKRGGDGFWRSLRCW
ncbi:P-loop containing nucleoside triphosphate hydrolase protein [Nemania sp. NC0429]|nr:P-loop containing nucleoside triphosphate hydrolase protein [Nemania sp. NC0429]